VTQTEFTQRVLAMEDRLYRVSCTLLRCEADREDAVQSALEKAWRGRLLLRQEQYME
jgi:DNA-directed RNA polymerase specialized sigma24 family protein